MPSSDEIPAALQSAGPARSSTTGAFPIGEFVEPGRRPAGEHLDAGMTARPTPAHLDPRIAGLDQVEKTKSRLFRRRKPSLLDANPTGQPIDARITSPVRISVVGLKGGVGKTTMAVLMATALARGRREPVLLLDADTTYGSLMLRTGMTSVATGHDLARQGDPGDRRVLETVISRTPDGVWVLPTGRNPAQSAAFSEETYVAAMRAVYRHFDITITDCGAGMAGGLMQRVISATHALVIATSPSMDGLLATYNALRWLTASGFGALAQRTVVAITNVSVTDPAIDIGEARARLSGLCRAVFVLPSDDRLRTGGHIVVDELDEQTRRTADDLAGVVLDAALSAH